MLWVLKRTGSFEHPKHMLKIMGKKIFTILRWLFLFMLKRFEYLDFCFKDFNLIFIHTYFGTKLPDKFNNDFTYQQKIFYKRFLPLWTFNL